MNENNSYFGTFFRGRAQYLKRIHSRVCFPVTSITGFTKAISGVFLGCGRGLEAGRLLALSLLDHWAKQGSFHHRHYWVIGPVAQLPGPVKQ